MFIDYRIKVFIFQIVFCFISYTSGFGQNTQRIAELRDSLKNAHKDSEQRRLLNKLGFEFSASFPDSTIYFSARVDEISDYPGDTSSQVQNLNNQGIAYTNLGDIQRARSLFQAAIQLASDSGDPLLLAESQNLLGRFYLRKGDLAKAYENLIQAQSAFEKSKQSNGRAEVYLSFSYLFRSQSDYFNAFDMASRSLAIKNNMADRAGAIVALTVLGGIYQSMGDLANAEVSYREAEFVAGQVEDEGSLAVVKLGLSELYLESGSLSKAESEGFRAENILQRLKNPSLVSKSALILGRIFFKKKDYRQAESYLTKCLKVSKLTGQMEIFMEANFYLARLYELKGQDILSSEFESIYRMLNDSIRNNELALQAEKFNYELTIKTNEQENELLKSNEQRNEATIKFQRIINFGALFIIGLVLFFSYLLWRGTKARKKVNKKLHIKNQQLNDINLEKDALMGIVAHDLKTPLANIKSILGMLPIFGKMTPKQVEFSNLMEESSDAGLNLIDELLDVHQLEVQKKANYQAVGLKELLQERVKYFENAALKKNISISLKVEGDVIFESDKDWLMRILDNLISNAIKFSPKSKMVMIGAGITGNEVWITILDQGPGFSASDKEKAFQKFKKLAAKPTGGESSNGLGLFIVRTLVQRLNGSISLISELGEGAEFIIRLPHKTG